MFEDEFVSRLTQLRLSKGVSARDMSLSIGQNPGYINNIESGKALPSLSVFFMICDYLHVSPKDFFDVENRQPERLEQIVADLKHLSQEQLDHMAAIIQELGKK